MLVGGGAAAEIGAALEKLDAIAGIGKGAGSGDAGESTTDDGDGFGRDFERPGIRHWILWIR